ncbi:MAG TPA: PTS glucose transporter subunit IIA [Candidatus Blautia excrementipullorum]|nr:PTS glucose transporter subunit IIA [Candidatus Blautia excrementipullorum]
MFGFFKKKENKFILGAPAKGKAVSLKEVNDPTFAEEMLGKGMAVIPSEGKIYAPADGEVGMVFDTFHAVSLTTDFGAEVLIHVGLDTVKLKGEGFTGHVKAGSHVKKGDLLLEVDLEKVRAAGYDTITPMLVCNTDEYASVTGLSGKNVEPGDDAVVIEK